MDLYDVQDSRDISWHIDVLYMFWEVLLNLMNPGGTRYK